MRSLLLLLLCCSVAREVQSSACAAGCPKDPKGCPGDLCCSLNGKLQSDGSCVCSKPWSGSRCSVMEFLPVAYPQGYGMLPNLTTWGASPVYDGQKYHIFVASMTNGCGLNSWQSNSRIDHAVSSRITGPYSFESVAVNTWAHNPALVTLPNGTHVLFHIGDGAGGPDGGANCSKLGGVRRNNNGSSIHVSSSLNGPWTPIHSTIGPCNNPSPWMHRNGTIFLVCSGGAANNGLHRAEDVTGPWTLVASDMSLGPPFPEGPWAIYEDPSFYMDHNDNFHLLYHAYEDSEPGFRCDNSTVSAHLFSSDGHSWHASPGQPYSSQINLSTGETVTFATRERPKLFFDTRGRPTHLFNGVVAAETCWPSTHGSLPGDACVNCKFHRWDFTLITPLDLGDDVTSTDQRFWDAQTELFI